MNVCITEGESRAVRRVGLINVWEFAGQVHPNKQKGMEKDGEEVINIMCTFSLVDKAEYGWTRSPSQGEIQEKSEKFRDWIKH